VYRTALLVGALALPVLCGAHEAAASTPAEPIYLAILGQPEEFSAEFPPAGPESDRQVGFGVLLYTLSSPVDLMVKQVEDALDKAERTGYPVLIHMDDWNYPAPSTDPDVVEWTAFPAEGEGHGPLVRRRWINWGSWFTVEAPPNYESRAFRRDVGGRFWAISRAIATRLRRWRAEGRAYLLAGVVVGWESGFYTAPEFGPGAEPRAGDQVLGSDERVLTGHAALTARGYTASAIRRMATEEREPEARVLHRLMRSVVHDYTAFLASVCRLAGIPQDRIYTHYAGLGALPAETVPPDVREDGRNMPLWAAINPNSRPGITATVPWTDVDRAAGILREQGRREWGAVEVEFTDRTRDEDSAVRYLDAMGDNGARVICVYGWWEALGHPFAVRGSGAVPAIRRWLARDTGHVTPAGKSPPAGPK